MDTTKAIELIKKRAQEIAGTEPVTAHHAFSAALAVNCDIMAHLANKCQEMIDSSNDLNEQVDKLRKYVEHMDDEAEERNE